jgi:hypothetical protein
LAFTGQAVNREFAVDARHVVDVAPLGQGDERHESASTTMFGTKHFVREGLAITAEVLAAAPVPSEQILADVVRGWRPGRFAFQFFGDCVADKIGECNALAIKARSELGLRRMVIVMARLAGLAAKESLLQPHVLAEIVIRAAVALEAPH